MSDLHVVRTGVCRQIPAPRDARETKARRLMSEAAVLAVAATRDAVAGWDRLADVGQFVGVGASGGRMADLERLLRASNDTGFSERMFAESGLRAAHPLLAFQLMNNFSMCHAAIDSGLGGPNRAVYSTGAGTVFAVVQALLSGADRCVVGGTDTGAHPIRVHQNGPGANGAAMLALERDGKGPRLVSARFHGRDAPPTPAADWVGVTGGRRSGWVELDVVNGAALAAGPALGWVSALKALETHRSAAVVSLGPDGQAGTVVFERAS